MKKDKNPYIINEDYSIPNPFTDDMGTLADDLKNISKSILNNEIICVGCDQRTNIANSTLFASKILLASSIIEYMFPSKEKQ